MTLQLTKTDVGQRFLRRDGHIVEIVDYHGQHLWHWEVQGGYTVNEKGFTTVNDDPQPIDLVSRHREAIPVPARATTPAQNVLRTLPDNPADRKAAPVMSGVLDYFPLAIAEVARISQAGNDQHNPGEPLHWARHKSRDHADCAARHLIERGTKDSDGQRHTAKAAWRMLALLQEELEAEVGWTPAPSQA